jgi:hypothetical protein
MRRKFCYEYSKGTEFKHTREDNIKIYAKKIGRNLWSGIMWSRIGFFEHGTELSSYVNSGESLEHRHDCHWLRIMEVG